MAVKAFCRLHLNDVIAKMVYSYLKMWKSAGKGYLVCSTMIIIQIIDIA